MKLTPEQWKNILDKRIEIKARNGINIYTTVEKIMGSFWEDDSLLEALSKQVEIPNGRTPDIDRELEKEKKEKNENSK